MSEPVAKEKLSAWERWELASFESAPKAGRGGSDKAAGEPTVELPTAEQIEEMHRAARREGHAEGYKAGFDAGYADARARGEAESARLAALGEQLDRAVQDISGQVADELLALAIELARQVVRHQIAAHPEGLLDVVREALAQLPYQHVTIFLHPEDASLVRSYLGDQLAHAGHRIHEDPHLARGDCVLEAGGSQLDASLATRWRRVLEGLGVQSAWSDDAKG